jgi:hypothetical protein
VLCELCERQKSSTASNQLPKLSQKTKVTAETSVVMEMAADARLASPDISEAIT